MSRERHWRGSTRPSQRIDFEDEDPTTRRMRAEAVLLLAKTPLSLRKLSQLAHLADATEARTLVRQLNQIYDELGRSLRIEQIAGGYRMLTRASLAPWLSRLAHLPPTVRLSSPMMETLAVVAYRQPVSRVNVEAVRGVACGELLRQLMERDLIRIAGRSEELGRPYLYGTTKRFLQLFGLTNTDALPPIQWQRLQEDPPTEDSPEELSTPMKESVVSTAVAPVVSDTDTETTSSIPSVVDSDESAVVNPSAVIEDEEDELYGDDEYDDDDDDFDDEDEDIDLDGDEEEGDWDDDDDDEDEDWDDEEEDDLDDDEWEEVGDEDADEELDEDDEDWDDEEDDDDEDWGDDEEEGDDDEDWE